MSSDGTPPSGQQQQAPVSSEQRYDKLEQRVRKLEDDYNRFTGVLSVLKWGVVILVGLIAAAASIALFVQRAMS